MNVALCRVRLSCLLLAVSLNIHANAAFDGYYSVTPPQSGIYQSFPFNWAYTYGNWTASGARMTVNTLEAPSRLELAVPSVSATGAGLRFEIRAPADGTVSFDSSTESIFPGHINWFQQIAGGPTSYVALDAGLADQTTHFSFAVHAGETFGFILVSGGDVSTPGTPPAHTLSIENFSGPVPEPSTLALLVVGTGWLARCRNRARADSQQVGVG